MVTTIFTDSISALEIEIQQVQERLHQLREAETIASVAMQSLQDAIATIGNFAPEALTILKNTVIELFPGTADSNTDGDDTPSEQLTEDSFQPETEKTAQTPSTESSTQPPYITLVTVSDIVAYQQKYNGFIQCVYAGFNNKQRAKAWGEFLSIKYSAACGFEVREPKHLTNWKYELKLWGMNLDTLTLLGEQDLTKSPPAEIASFPTRQPLPVQNSQALALPEFTLIEDTSFDAILGTSYLVYGIDNDRRCYGKVHESLTRGGWSHSQQRDWKVFPSAEEAAKALLIEFVNDERIHREANAAIISRFMEPESDKADPFGGFSF